MKTVKLIDTTLSQTDSFREHALTFKEKLEMARSLDRVKVDMLELPPLSGGKADQLSNRTIASLVSAAVSATVGVNGNLVDDTWESVRNARSASLNVSAPVSTVQMEYACHMKAPAMLKAISDTVKKCRFHCEQVEFTAVDATRAERDFLVQAVRTAIEAGATRITLCDTAGILLPGEYGTFFREVRDAAGSEGVEFYAQTANAMSMACACAASALIEGADGVKCSAVPTDLPALEDLVRFVELKGTALDLATRIRTTELSRTVSQLNRMLGADRDEAVQEHGTPADMPGVCLDANDDIQDVIKVIHQLGYDLSDEDNSKVYEAFRQVAESKHFVGPRELDAIIASTAMQVPSAYKLDTFVINSGNVISATANLCLEKDGEKLRSVAVGDGPVDASFLAIEQIIGHHYELDDFQIQTVTEGREAMGSALVKLRANGKLYSGNGISTDIIGASIRAYLSALNKIVYDEA